MERNVNWGGVKLKRLATILLSMAIALTFMPGSGLFVAEKAHAATQSGYVGRQLTITAEDNYFDKDGNPLTMTIDPVYWELDDAGNLTIGNGADNQVILGYRYYDNPIPFESLSDSIKKISFNGNVNYIEPDVGSLFTELKELEEFDATGLRLGDPILELEDQIVYSASGDETKTGGFVGTGMFYGCEKIRKIDLRNTGFCENWVHDNGWDDEEKTFYNCSSLEELYLGFDESVAKAKEKKYYLGKIFVGCKNLKSSDAVRLISYVLDGGGSISATAADGSDYYEYWNPTASNVMNLADGYYLDYPEAYHSLIKEKVEAINSELLRETWNPTDIVIEVKDIESQVSDYITAEEHKELLEMKDKAENILKQNPFPYSPYVSQKLEQVSEYELDSEKRKEYATNIKDAYNNAMAEIERTDARNALADAISAAENKLKDKDKYTDDTIKDLEDALDKAKDIVADTNATKDNLEKAKNDLDDAIAGLKEKDAGGNDPGTGGGGNDPGTGGGGNDPGTGGGGSDPGTGGSTGGNTGGNTGGSTGGNTGDNTGGDTGGSTGGNTGGNGGNDPNAPGTKVYNNMTYVEVIKYIPAEVTPETPASLSAVEAAILKAPNDNDIKGSTYAPLKFLSKKQTKKSIKLQWSKVKGAKKYTVYGNLCGKGKKYKKIKTVKGKSLNLKTVAGKKIKKGKYYKFIIVAENGDKAVALSKTIHVASAGKKKVANNTKVTVSKKVIKKAKKLKAKKTLALKAKAEKKKGTKVAKHVKVRYESSNKKVATVSKAGKVKAKKKGSCYIYAYAQNGIAKKIKVKVK